jgi:drug/metabolite transporter (DMT)-like permease
MARSAPPCQSSIAGRDTCNHAVVHANLGKGSDDSSLATAQTEVDRTSQFALGALFLGAAGIAFSPIFVRLSELGPTATAFWRPTMALPAMLGWMCLEQNRAGRRPTRLVDFAYLALAGLFFAGDLAFWHWSIKLTSVANSTLLANFAPIFVTLASWLLFSEKVGLLFVTAMTGALIGTALIVGASLSSSPRHLLGDALGLVTAVFYAAYIITIKRLRGHFSAATTMAWSATVTAIALLPVAWLSGEHLIAATALGWLILIGLGLVSHAGGQGLIAYALAHLRAGFSSVTLLSEPVLATIFAWLLLGEGVGYIQVLGGVLVLAGIFLARRERKF